MDIENVALIIGRIADGFEESCMRCLDDNKVTVLQAVREQLYSGQDGEGNYLTPTYDDDPFFEEEGYWKGRAKDYKAWKKNLTPPEKGLMLGLDPRPEHVPNLYINGTFYGEITAFRQGDVLVVDPGANKGPDIVKKYKERILELGPAAVEFFNENYLLPSIESFFKSCGYV